MAIYHGARVRTTALPPADVVRARPRVSAPASVQGARRVRPAGLLMAAIVAATMLGLVYLTQTLGSNATNYEIGRLEAHRAELTKELRRQVVVAQDLIDNELIATKARARGLRKLGDAIVLSAP